MLAFCYMRKDRCYRSHYIFTNSTVTPILYSNVSWRTSKREREKNFIMKIYDGRAAVARASATNQPGVILAINHMPAKMVVAPRAPTTAMGPVAQVIIMTAILLEIIMNQPAVAVGTSRTQRTTTIAAKTITIDSRPRVERHAILRRKVKLTCYTSLLNLV